MYTLNATLLKISGGASARNFDAGIGVDVHYSGSWGWANGFGGALGNKPLGNGILWNSKDGESGEKHHDRGKVCQYGGCQAAGL